MDKKRPEELASTVEAGNSERDDAVLKNEPRNIFALAVYMICMRVSWIFKTETVIMPAFLDVISGQGWLRGCLPILNRFGQSVPPILFSDRLQASPVKSRSLFATSLWMAAPFLLLSLLWAWRTDWTLSIFPVLFLILYAITFAATGINQLVFGTVQGKLIRPEKRGRLMAISGIVGSILAILAAWFLLKNLLEMPSNDGFTWIFLVTGGGFAIGALTLFLIQEPADQQKKRRLISPLQSFRSAASILKNDAPFRRMAIVATLVMTSLFLFPHYQWLGREKLGFESGDLMTWVVVQNAGVGAFSWIAGLLADRYGYRIVIRGLIFSVCCVPLLAVFFAFWAPEIGRSWFTLVYLFLGLLPVTMKAMINYVLELADESEHPRYLSALSACMAAPFILSPFVGALFDAFPVIVFCSVSGLVFLGGLLTFTLVEPRSQHPEIHVPLQEIPQ